MINVLVCGPGDNKNSPAGAMSAADIAFKPASAGGHGPRFEVLKNLNDPVSVGSLVTENHMKQMIEVADMRYIVQPEDSGF
mgnify:CR=1 FL=1|tara:strand:- start:692 stop:934 length:243 start_codon:yes stop_codon:yes gene_type:complete